MLRCLRITTLISILTITTYFFFDKLNMSATCTGGVSASATKMPARSQQVSDQSMKQPEVSQGLQSLLDIAGNDTLTIKDPDHMVSGKDNLMDEQKDNDERIAETNQRLKQVTNAIRVAAAPGARGLRTNAADIEARNNALKLLRDDLQNLINMQKNLVEIRSNTAACALSRLLMMLLT